MNRYVLALALSMLMVTGGCLGFVQGDEPLAFSADPATVSESALDGAGYGNETVQNVTVNETVNVQNQTREVEVTNWNVRYTKSVELAGMSQDAAMFTTFTTPQFDIFGQALNPVGQMSNEELLKRALQGQSGLQNVTKVSESTATVLGEEANVTTFEATMSGGGDYLSYEQTLSLHMTKVKHGNDYVIAVGIHPAELEGERENYFRLLSGLRHESE